MFSSLPNRTLNTLPNFVITCLNHECVLQDQEQYWYDPSTPYKMVSPSQFSELFKKSRTGELEHSRLNEAYQAEAQQFDVSSSAASPTPPF